jgi:hypothetical protein
MKTCKKCMLNKTIDEFNRDTYQKDGYTSTCKECRNAVCRIYRQKLKTIRKNIPAFKTCPTCKIYKESKYFYKCASEKDGLQTYCKKCIKKPSRERSRQHTKKWRNKIKDKAKKNIHEKKCSKCKKIKKAEYFSEDKYCLDGYTYQCKKCRSENTLKYRKSEIGKEKIRAADKKRLNENPNLRLHKNVSRTITAALKRQNGSKNNCTIMNYLSYSFNELKEHLEKQFEDWMTWENYGLASIYKSTWNVDHIMPQSKLIYDSMDHSNFKKCWDLKNLRPLSAVENIRKSNKVEGCHDSSIEENKKAS